jgi:hypothetical protein
MSNHSFNPIIAKKFGVHAAIFIDSLIYWTRTNAANKHNFRNGRYWSYGTPEFFLTYFNYLSPRQIQYTLMKLTKNGIFLKDNFNQKGYDRTNWYSLSDEILLELNLDITCLQPNPRLIRQICSMDSTNLSDGLDKFVRPIPDTKPNIKTTTTTTTQSENKTKNPESVSSVVVSNSLTPIDRLREAYRAKPVTTDNITNEDEFIDAAQFSIKTRTKGISEEQRIFAIIKLVSLGTFRDPANWKPKKASIHVEERINMQEEISKRKCIEEYEKYKSPNQERKSEKPIKRGNPVRLGDIFKTQQMRM